MQDNAVPPINDLCAIKESDCLVFSEANGSSRHAGVANWIEILSDCYVQAIKLLHSAELYKDSAVLYNNLAATGIQTGRPAAALHYCEKALLVLPSSPFLPQ